MDAVTIADVLQWIAVALGGGGATLGGVLVRSKIQARTNGTAPVIPADCDRHRTEIVQNMDSRLTQHAVSQRRAIDDLADATQQRFIETNTTLKEVHGMAHKTLGFLEGMKENRPA